MKSMHKKTTHKKTMPKKVKTNKMLARLSSARYSALVIVALFSVSLIGCSESDSSKGSVKGNVTERMQSVVDNLVTSYNTLDSANFRRHFGPALLVDASLGATGQLIRESQSENGKIAKVDIEASADGRSAVVTFHMEKNTFNASIELDFNGRMTVFDWAQKN